MSFRKEGCKGGAAMVTMLMFFLIILATTIEASESATPEGYLLHWCNPASNYTQGSPVEKNLQHVLGELPNETASSTKSYHTSIYGEIPSGVYAVAMCRGDITETQCRRCVGTATSWVHKLCQRGLGGTFWYNHCFLDWRNYTGSAPGMDGRPLTIINDRDIASNITVFSRTVSDLFVRLIAKALQSTNTKRFAWGKAALDSIHTVYGLVQCWGDISIEDCRTCLANQYDNIGRNATKSGLLGAQSFTRNCLAHYENSNFFGAAATPSTMEGPTPVPATSSRNTKPDEKSTRKLIIILGFMGGSMLILFFLVSSYCFMAFRKEKPLDTMSVSRQGSFQNYDDQNVWFTVETLMIATSNFHENHKLGEGSFGVVYKGTLANGKDVAIKKLSLRSLQGRTEFMSEIKLLSRVQHRNLVILLGCCIDGFERILVYEYLANKSLDKHLFDLEKKIFLDWEKRMNIILGVAKGLSYLHEDSKLKIIHRDIKASNILLDDNFNAKIGDFGLAKLFSEDESYIQTRVAGTFGYMAPEYAMNGELSTKADVYSFGILILEITSGRSINDTASNTRKNLLQRAWKLYRRGEFLSIVDKDIKKAQNYEQILRCSHVGLLCTQADPSLRPPMSEVLMMLSSKSVTMPNPTKPAFISTTSASEIQRNIDFSSDSLNSTPEISHFDGGQHSL